MDICNNNCLNINVLIMRKYNNSLLDISEDLKRVISSMMNPNQLERPTAPQLLKDPVVKRYILERANQQAVCFFNFKYFLIIL